MEQVKTLLKAHFNGENVYYANLEDALLKSLPHGSGIDCHWEIDYFKNGKIKCSNAWHKMNDNGYYIGYLDFSVTIGYNKKADRLTIGTVKIRNWNMIKDYLEEVFGQFEDELNA